MHGIVMKALKDYVVAEHGRSAWRAVRERAAVERRLYAPVARYPDCHGRELAAAARGVVGDDEPTLQFEVGRHLAPTLLRVYGRHVDGADSGLELLADAERVVTEALRRKGPRDVDAPDLAGERIDERRVVVRYRGDWCVGLRGLVAGLGERYGETYAVSERTCVGEGADRCELVVARSPAPGDGAAACDD